MTPGKDHRSRTSPRLTVVGTGIRLGGQITLEAVSAIQNADAVFYLAGNVGFGAWICHLNERAVSLDACYAADKPRPQSYAEMVAMVMTALSEGRSVCAAFYGHPGVGVDPGHEMVRAAKASGIPARMLPGVSAEACLYADLGLDPLARGCQSFEASDFVSRQPAIVTSTPLLLWQIGIVGEAMARFDTSANLAGVEMLVSALAALYPVAHEVIAYEAATYPVCEPIVDRLPLADLPRARLSRMTTLLVPPIEA